MVNSSVFELVSRSRHVAGASTTWDDEYNSTEGLSSLLLIFLQDSKLSRYGGIKGRLYITDSGKFPNCVGPSAFPPQNQRDPLPFINFQIGKNKKYLTT